MKYSLLIVALLLVGCQKVPTPVVLTVSTATGSVPNTTPAKPCVTGAIPATIREKTPQDSHDWNETHETSCPENMKTVLPSLREIRRDGDKSDNFSKWEAEHELCIPDGLR